MSKKARAKRMVRTNGVAKKKDRRRLYAGIAAAAAAALVAIAIALWQTKDEGLGPNDPVATVNGEPISYGEFAHEVNANRAAVIGYYGDKYGAEYAPGFWKKDFGGGDVPAERLEKLSLAASVNRKIQQIEAREQGVAESIDYAGLLRDMKATNAERKKKVERNEVIYGPVTLDEQRFIDDSLINLSRDLKIKLRPSFEITDDELKRYYEDNKETFALGDGRKVRAIEAAFSDEEDKKQRYDEAKAQLEAIADRLDAGEAFDDVYGELANGGTGSVLAASEKAFDNTMPRTEGIRRPNLLGAVGKLAENETTGIVEDSLAIGIYECEDLYSLDYSSFEDVKLKIENDLTDKKYAEFIDGLRESAKVEVLQANMSKVKWQ